MEIKDLNKSQLILLALLLSFVTSLATGITTVTLMQQAPESLITPITQVVRETVDKVIPQAAAPAPTVTVVKEEDMIVSAVASNKSAIFSVTKSVPDQTGKMVDTKIANAFAVSDKGVVVTDPASVSSSIAGTGTYFLENASGRFNSSVLPGGSGKFSLLQIGTPVNQTDKISFSTPKSADIAGMKAGQELLVLGDGIYSFIYDGNPDLSPDQVKLSGDSLVINLDGEALGFVLSGSGFVPFSAVNSALTQ